MKPAISGGEEEEIAKMKEKYSMTIIGCEINRRNERLQ